MAKEIRIVTLTPGQQVPAGSTGIGYDGGIMWEGEAGTFPAGYTSTVMSIADYRTYKKDIIREAANEIILTAYPLWYQSNVALGVYASTIGDPMKTHITNIIEESNDCEDDIDSAATIEAVQAVTPTWPEE
jgi:hypothetical protein